MAELSKADVRFLREIGAWYRQEKSKRNRPPQARPGRMVGGGLAIKIQAPENGIPARDGTRAGKAECAVLTTIMTGTEADIITTTRMMTIYNSITLAVLANGERSGHAALHDDGLWWATVGDCNDSVN